MFGPFVHRIDPLLADIGGVYLWFYGLSYSLGFISVFLWFKRVRHRFDFTIGAAYSLTICLALGVLAGGRVLEVFFYEWAFYREHLWLIPAVWLGGMSTHGVLLGVLAAVWLFCRIHRKSLLSIGDQLVIPGSYLMGMGRLGNFIDGQIVGGATNVWWAVQFPDALGFRHPVVLYDGVKNFLILGLLLWLRRKRPAPGMLIAYFVFCYAFLRIFVDLFREYPTSLFGIATGQAFNILMTALGALLIFRFSRSDRATIKANPVSETVPGSELPAQPRSLWPKRIFFASLLLLPLTIPSDWTQDIPARYGKRHAGLHHSFLYPPIEGNIPANSK